MMRSAVTYLLISQVLLQTALLGRQKTDQEIELTYSLATDQKSSLEAVVTDEEEYEPVAGNSVKFYSLREEEEKFIGEAMSNDEGVAVLTGINRTLLLRHPNGMIEIKAVSSETDALAEGATTISQFDAELKLDFVVIDSVPTLNVELLGIKDGQPLGLPDGEIYFFVTRLFGELNIGEAWTDEDGKDSFEFPMDLPGGPEGELDVIARISDSEEYGNIEVRSTVNWGVVVDDRVAELPRALWSPKPPLWMVITFAILMTGVWGHYLWVIINLFKIRKLKSGD